MVRNVDNEDTFARIIYFCTVDVTLVPSVPSSFPRIRDILCCSCESCYFYFYMSLLINWFTFSPPAPVLHSVAFANEVFRTGHKLSCGGSCRYSVLNGGYQARLDGEHVRPRAHSPSSVN